MSSGALNKQFIVMVGPAGSGKTTLTASFGRWLEENQGYSVGYVNLDPGVEKLPYRPDVDARRYVRVRDVMEKLGLGPNGALIASVDMLLKHAPELVGEISSLPHDFVIVDTPGQLELFAFRREGLILAENIGVKGRKTMLFILDPIFCTNVRNFVASTFLASSIYLSFGLPIIQVLNKIDAVPRGDIERIEGWSESMDSLLVDLEDKLKGGLMVFSREVAQAVYDIVSNIPIIPVSSITMEGFPELHATLTRIVSEGELELR